MEVLLVEIDDISEPRGTLINMMSFEQLVILDISISALLGFAVDYEDLDNDGRRYAERDSDDLDGLGEDDKEDDDVS